MAWARTRWIMAGVAVIALVLANPFRRESPQQAFYRELADRHAAIAAWCRMLERQARARGDIKEGDRLRAEALRRDRVEGMFRQGSYKSDAERSWNAPRP